ncbi:lipopolysaccharide biosynthesis protein [Bordetella avium]|uniref:Capsular polysaccharide biosynthesis protein n=1 Tax=Bordetella avium (strain 197N) TaxID=360910 RepID=Q2KWN2_BORA1|nr:capsular polysaccharide biosynthesis protein [Bordetella avium]AZY53350.1 capsular biosynthesis protein [Bordetella avium]RIQ52017.1 capsular biosynthesis protein [Bordetella avium]RIQ68564.1 capsular biosynthesis protein [Bordetella avium]RIQ69141.1 capsular biosynthesis protein [Bordetella avium]CAJ50255.1 putative capsular polysaccharide biosynthesis protein [Bordetella avium 197N]
MTRSKPGFARLFGSSIIDQALLSAANLGVGLILIRYAAEAQYGYYILAFNTMMLLTTLQGTFIGTPLVIRLPAMDAGERRQWMGSLLRDQWRLGAWGGALVLLFVLGGWAAGLFDSATALVAAAATMLVLAALYREYLRGILLMYHRPQQVLAADVVYAVLLLGGCALAAQVSAAAAGTLLGATLAALVCARLLRRHLADDIDRSAAPGRLRDIARMGFWAASGGVIYWLFNQGYNFLTAATLDLAAVAALAATRLTLMPINLLLAGMQKQLAPLASDWMHRWGARRTLRRLMLFSLALGLFTLAYGVVLWLLRDWIFLDLMRKDFAQRDVLLLLWCGLFILMVMREPVMMIAVLRQRFRALSGATLACALLALAISYVGMRLWGPMGAAIGILVGEACFCAAVGMLVWRETHGAQNA